VADNNSDLFNSLDQYFERQRYKTLSFADQVRDHVGLTFQGIHRAYSNLQDQVTQIAQTFGGIKTYTDEITDSLVFARDQVALLGGDFDSVKDMQINVIQQLQTQTLLNKESFDDFFASAMLVSDSLSSVPGVAAEIAKNFKDIGFSLYDATDQVMTIVQEARRFGATTIATYSQVNQNIQQLNLYNFRTGIKGISEMAAQAAVLRINMSDTLRFAEKIFNPEQAIEAAAAFQRLGVSIPELLDPYKLLDMARNAPEELQKSIIDATKSLTYFDEESRRIRILPQAQEQLRLIASELGIGQEEFAKMAINASKFEKVMQDVDFEGIGIPEDLRNYISSIAEMGEGGEWKINIGDKGEMRSIYELGGVEMDKLRKQMEMDNMDAVEVAKGTFHTLQEINNLLLSWKDSVSMPIAGSRSAQTLVERDLGGLVDLGKDLGNSIRESVGVSLNETLGQNLMTSVDKSFEPLLSDLGELIETIRNSNLPASEILQNVWVDNIVPPMLEMNDKLSNISWDKIDVSVDNDVSGNIDLKLSYDGEDISDKLRKEIDNYFKSDMFLSEFARKIMKVIGLEHDLQGVSKKNR